MAVSEIATTTMTVPVRRAPSYRPYVRSFMGASIEDRVDGRARHRDRSEQPGVPRVGDGDGDGVVLGDVLDLAGRWVHGLDDPERALVRGAVGVGVPGDRVRDPPGLHPGRERRDRLVVHVLRGR